MRNKENDYVKLYNIGDVLYRVGKYGIEEVTIIKIDQFPHYVYRDDHGHSYFNHNIVKTCFKTKEEADNELYRRERVKEKRQRLKEYEELLNEKLNLEGHFIVK